MLRRSRTAWGALLLPLTLALPLQAEEVRVDGNVPPPEAVAVPIAKGQIEKAVGQIDRLAQTLMMRTGLPGLAVVVVHEGKTLFLKGFGVRKVGAPETVDADTVFQLASLSKSVGATVVAHEVGRGIVSWETPVRSILPWFSLKDPWVGDHVTIADLYSHRSGLPGHAGDDLEDMGYDRRNILERLKLLPLAPFRVSYAYTNFGVTAGAEAVAEAAGKDWASLSDEVLYKPLGMTATSSRFSDYIARTNRAFPHVKIGDAFVAKFQREPDAQSPAGGVSSSARDMGKWLAMVLGDGTFEGKEIVSAKALLPAVSAQMISSPSYAPAARAGFYGYGIGVSTAPSGRVTLSHSGAFYLGAGTNYLLLPSEKLGIVVLTNAWPDGAAESLAMDFMDLVQFGTVTRDWLVAFQGLMAPMFRPEGALAGKAPPKDPVPAKPASAYVGTYENAYFGPAEVREEAGKLMLVVGPKPVRVELSHWSGDDFTYVPTGENAPFGTVSQVQFALKGDKGAEAKAGAVTIEFLNRNGLGTFTRK